MSERKEWISPLAHLALTREARRAMCVEATERLRGPRREGVAIEGTEAVRRQPSGKAKA